MQIKLIEESPAILAAYSNIPISFEVISQLRVEVVSGGMGGIRLVEEAVEAPYVKDYDAGERPTDWPRQWDLQNWGILSAFVANERVGGAAVAWRTPAVNMLEGRDDLAVLWDIRVDRPYRGKGVGKRLFDAVVAWARDRGCVRLKIETQNINVGACRFYARQGCELGGINRWAYAALPQEVQLLWYLEL